MNRNGPIKTGMLGVIIGAHALWLSGDKRGFKLDLSGADMRGADMRGADMRGADMRGADMRGANMRWADMREADMRGADMSGADMSGADMRNLIGNGSPDMLCIQDHWNVCMTKDAIAIGCHQHPVADWWSFDDETISGMDSHALEWWRTHKHVLQALHAAKWGEK